MATNRSSLSSADEIQHMLDDLSGNTDSPFASANVSHPGEFKSLSLSQGGVDVMSELVSSSSKLQMHSKFDLGTGGNLKPEGKPLPVFYLRQDHAGEVCCGLIGSHKGVFCLKHKLSCSVGSHSTSKFQPEGNTYYVCKSMDKTLAYCSLSFSQKSFASSSLKDLDLSQPRSLEQWRTLIKSVNATMDLDVKPVSEHTSNTSEAQNVDRKDPKISFSFGSDKYPNTSVSINPEQDQSHSSSPFEVLDPSVLKHLDNLQEIPLKSILESHHLDIHSIIKHLNDFIRKWDVIEQEMIDLNNNVSAIQRDIRTNSKTSFVSVWDGIDAIMNNLDGIDLDDLQSSVNHTSMEHVEFKDTLIKFKKYWEALAANWLPRVTVVERELFELKSNFHQQTESSQSSQREKILDSLFNTKQPPTFTQHQNQNSSQVNPISLVDDLKGRLDALETSYQELNSKFVSLSTSQQSIPQHNIPHENLGIAGVHYRQYFFKDPHDLESWMRSCMTHPSHGLFVDLVSFSEFFGADFYVDRNTTLNEVYMSSKIGYASIANSIVASSFQNVLPAANGKPLSTSKNNKLEIFAQAELPGLPTFKKWDNRDGRNGRRFWIRDESRKTEQQLDGYIRSQLTGASQILAKDLLVDSFAMSDAIYTFISSSYEDSMNSGRFDSDQSWTLTCSFVKRIFQEIAYERVIARDGIHIDNQWSTSSKFLFATLKAHSVMQQFMKLSIKDHPSISSETVKFVCYAQPTADSTELISRISGVESLQRADQSNISKMDTKIKKIEAWKTDSDKLLKKLKEKVNI